MLKLLIILIINCYFLFVDFLDLFVFWVVFLIMCPFLFHFISMQIQNNVYRKAQHLHVANKSKAKTNADNFHFNVWGNWVSNPQYPFSAKWQREKSLFIFNVTFKLISSRQRAFELLSIALTITLFTDQESCSPRQNFKRV